MDYNYHTHTSRCKHATGTDREYVEVALKNGIRYLGFSDHIPFAFPDGKESWFRVPLNEVEEYFSSLRALGEEFRDRMEIKVGFEAEYYPSHFDTMLKNAIAWNADYLIVGQHFIAEEYPNGISCHKPSDCAEYLKEYVDCVVAAMEMGVVTYIAHPDLYPFVGDWVTYEEQMYRICHTANRTNTPLELNFLGMREHRNYPDERFWRLAGMENCPVTFGCDAHHPAAVFDAASLQKARAMVQQYHLNYIGRPRLKPLG